jgi:hypothetical protein
MSNHQDWVRRFGTRVDDKAFLLGEVGKNTGWPVGSAGKPGTTHALIGLNLVFREPSSSGTLDVKHNSHTWQPLETIQWSCPLRHLCSTAGHLLHFFLSHFSTLISCYICGAKRSFWTLAVWRALGSLFWQRSPALWMNCAIVFFLDSISRHKDLLQKDSF